MAKEQMMDKVINRYGFEATETIDFCLMCEAEEHSNEYIKACFKLMCEAEDHDDEYIEACFKAMME